MVDNLQKVSFIAQIHNFVRTKAQDAFWNQGKTFPGHVSKILENDFIEFTFDATGPFTLPKVQIPQAFSKYHREPTKVGDKGYAVPGDISIGVSSGQDGSTPNMYPRGNLGSLTYHPISNKGWPKKDPDMFLVTAGSKGHTLQSEDGKTTKIIDQANNIIDTSANILSHAAQTIQQIAQSGLTHAIINGTFNLVAKNFTVGAPGSSEVSTFDTTNPPTPPTPPQPTSQTIFTVIGNIVASGMMAAAGGMAGAGSPGGPPIANPPAGASGEVISSTVATGIAISNTVPMNVTSITLTPGDWDVHGEVWFLGASAASAFVAGINNVSATFPNQNVGFSRTQFAGTLASSNILPLRTARVLITVNTVYYLVAQCNYTAGSATASGCIWARRH
jgi:hypothetical protein